MFKFQKKPNSIDLVGEGVAFKNISISVNAENGRVFNLPISRVEDGLIYGVCDEAEATVKIIEKDGILTLVAEGGLIRDRSKNQFYDHPNTNLNANAAFSFTFAEIEGLKSYTASNLTTFWTQNDVIGGSDIKKVVPKTNKKELNKKLQEEVSEYLEIVFRHPRSHIKGDLCNFGAFCLSLLPTFLHMRCPKPLPITDLNF